MIALCSLAVVSNLDGPEVEEWLNSGDLHRSNAVDGSSVICVNSLLAHLGGGKSAERGLAQANKETT